MTWTVPRRIALGFSLVLALALVLSLASIRALQTSIDAFHDSLRQEREVTEVALEAESHSREATLGYLRYLLEARPEHLARRDSMAALTRELLQILRDRAPAEDTRAAWSDALDRLTVWERTSAASIAALQAGDRQSAVASWSNEALSAREDLRDAIDAAVETAKRRGEEIGAAAEETSARMQRRLWLMSLLLLIVGTAAAWLLNRAVTDPLRETSGVLASSAAEILASTTQQASSASETSAAIVETSTTVDEVAETAKQATDRARSVAESAKRAAEIGKNGRNAVETSVTTMGEVQEQVETIAQSIVALAEQAQAIGDIIATVNDVAEQTNLLALNAAVEAARAGEHGRGFAVVAGEVRSLAEQSRRATVQVRQILGEIQAATNAAVMTTERGSHQVAAGRRQIEEAGDTIRALADAVAEAAQSAAQIVASAGEQSVGMDQIRQAMANVQEATHQTLASIHQAESAAQDLNRLGGRLVTLVGRDRHMRADGRGRV